MSPAILAGERSAFRPLRVHDGHRSRPAGDTDQGGDRAVQARRVVRAAQHPGEPPLSSSIATRGCSPALQDPALCAAARDRLWSLNETQQLRRDDPSSWVGPLSGDDLSNEGKNAFYAYRWNCRIPGSEDVLRDLFPRNAVVLAIAEQLLGRGRLSDPDSETRGTRGVYCTLPMGDKPKSRASCHIDDCIDSRTRIDAVCYIDDVKPGAGAFTVWPGSHHKCYRFLTTSADSAANGYAKPSEQQHNRNGGPDSRPSWALGMQEAWEWCEENIHPVDCWGDAGTVVVSHLPARLPCTAIPSLSRLLTRCVPCSSTTTNSDTRPETTTAPTSAKLRSQASASPRKPYR